ncbi:MAG: hypothetical protein C0507_13340 [Cyanobacteria bacterium PR.3.49]|nr:hypothetical protein [Cyanobacteria bacterium PR.3.49]
MKRRTQGLISILLSLSFIVLPAPPAKACAPDLAYAILINGNHPDLPLKLFAGGNIGIVQPGWAKSYLVVAYRNLIGKPLSKVEQDSIVNLWHARIISGSRFDASISNDPKDAYLKLRARAIGADPKKSGGEIYWKMDSFAYDKGISDSAFALARDTLSGLVKKYSVKSAPVRDWVKAQDGLFGIGSDKVIVPAALSPSADQLLQDARIYQIAAAHFYLKKFDGAAAQFQKLAAKQNSTFKQIASYMVLRSKSNAVLINGASTPEIEAVSSQIQNAADAATKTSAREDLLDLQRPISYLNLSQLDVTKKLATSIANGTSNRFGGDVGDLTFLLDGNMPLSGLNVQGVKGTAESGATAESVPNDLMASHDLADWILTVQNNAFLDYDNYGSEEEKAKSKAQRDAKAAHALAMWRKKNSELWLVAALMTNGLRSNLQDLYDAATNVASNSPAYATCRFYLADFLLTKTDRHAVKKALMTIWSMKTLPPSTRNLFSMQMAAACYTPGDYLKYSVLNPPEVLQSTTALVSPKFAQLASADNFQTETPTFDLNVAQDLSRNAPLSTWMSFAQSQNLPAKFKPAYLRAAWTRAQLLQQSDDAADIADEVGATNPKLSAALAKIKNAPAGPAKQFAIAAAILKNYGMSPYLQGGAERHGLPITEFDYYNNNYWVPFGAKKEDDSNSDYYSYNSTVGFCGSDSIKDMINTYSKFGVSSRLSDAEKRAAAAERALLLKNHPSRFLGQAVLDWQKTHPGDPDVPELLYRIVKLPKWTDVTPVGSEFSKKAYLVLHQKYPANSWTKKAVCYY